MYLSNVTCLYRSLVHKYIIYLLLCKYYLLYHCCCSRRLENRYYNIKLVASTCTAFRLHIIILPIPIYFHIPSLIILPGMNNTNINIYKQIWRNLFPLGVWRSITAATARNPCTNIKIIVINFRIPWYNI